MATVTRKQFMYKQFQRKLKTTNLEELSNNKKMQAQFRRKLLDSFIRKFDTTDSAAVGAYNTAKKALIKNGVIQENTLGRASPAYAKQAN